MDLIAAGFGCPRSLLGGSGFVKPDREPSGSGEATVSAKSPRVIVSASYRKYSSG
jgi:hypothetical protein